MGGLEMNRRGCQDRVVLSAIVMVIIALGAAVNSAASAETTLEELCGACKVEVFVKGGKFLEGPTFDQEGNLWVVNIESGWSRRLRPCPLETTRGRRANLARGDLKDPSRVLLHSTCLLNARVPRRVWSIGS